VIRAVVEWLKKRLELPQVRGLDHDSPELIRIHRDLIQRKRFLRSLYSEHYREFARALEGAPTGPIVEFGSGGGFLKEIIPEVITTDLYPGPDIDRVMTAEKIDFPDGSLAAVLMLNVFHHLPDPRLFLREATRVLKPGGRAILIEPAHTRLWRLLYRLFSAEPYDEAAKHWGFSLAGRFSGANIPQAWIVFSRDRLIFEREFSTLHLRSAQNHTAFLFLLSGGIWFRGLVPSWSFPFFLGVERLLEPTMPLLACQTTFLIEKRQE
jgi:SAM-dependent methyltransferase